MSHREEQTAHRLCYLGRRRNLGVSSVGRSPRRQPGGDSPSAHQDLIATYCTSCHNERLKTAGLALDRISVNDVASAADVWEKVVRKVRGGLMPPAGARRPDATASECARDVARDRTRSRVGHPSQSRAAASSPAESRGIRQRRSRSPGASRWMSPHCCRRMIRPTASTTSPMP